MEETIRFEMNNKMTEIFPDPKLTVLWVLGNQSGLTGTKYGRGMGFCGAYTIIPDNKPGRSCMLPVIDAAGKEMKGGK